MDQLRLIAFVALGVFDIAVLDITSCILERFKIVLGCIVIRYKLLMTSQDFCNCDGDLLAWLYFIMFV